MLFQDRSQIVVVIETMKVVLIAFLLQSCSLLMTNNEDTTSRIIATASLLRRFVLL